MTDARVNLLGLTRPELEAWCVERGGKAFRARQLFQWIYKRGETELVIVVTPYLVKPVNDGDIVLPTDGYSAPGELQRLLGNMETGSHKGPPRPKPTVAPSGQDSPTIGMSPLDGASDPGKPQKPAKREKRAANETPAPGFSLN